MTAAWVPPALLAVYAVAFGARALGGGLLVFDDHPGQLYRVVHAITVGLAPWRFDPGWWAGYAELQYYPPGFAWLGALLHHAAGGALSTATVYQALLWLAWVLPGATTYVLDASRAVGVVSNLLSPTERDRFKAETVAEYDKVRAQFARGQGSRARATLAATELDSGVVNIATGQPTSVWP